MSVQGMSPMFLARDGKKHCATIGCFAYVCQMAGDENATPEAGPWRLTLDMPSYLPTMQHLKNRSVREKMYRAFTTRASSLGATPEGEARRKDPGHVDGPLVPHGVLLRLPRSEGLKWICWNTPRPPSRLMV